MPYITSVERFGIEKGKKLGILQGILQGRQEGRQEGMAKNAKEFMTEALSIRFGEVPTSVIEKLEKINDIALLKSLHKNAITEASIEKFEQAFNNTINKGLSEQIN